MATYIEAVPSVLQHLVVRGDEDNMPPAIAAERKLSIWNMRPGGIAFDMQQLLMEGGRAVVTPTKVGYIVMTTDAGGLEKKFLMKQRPKSKPGVVLCSSLEQLRELAVVSDTVMRLYESCWRNDILLGCILPWRPDAADSYIPNDGSRDMVQDHRGTSCFVIKYGEPSERIAASLWINHRKLAFASSVNPSGKGNRGRLEFVGDSILEMADHLVFADDYVSAQQPDKTEASRWEQGVMVSLVDGAGQLDDHMPVIIRKGLDLERIQEQLDAVFGHHEMAHGQYH